MKLLFKTLIIYLFLMAKKLILLYGCTGFSGYHIAKQLLKDNSFALRVVVRNETKCLDLFSSSHQQFEQIIEGKIDEVQILKKSFQQSSQHGSVKTVISALGARTSRKETYVQDIETKCQISIINQAKKSKVDKFILVSAALISKYNHFVPFILNTIIPNVMGYKAKTENHLRVCGINYAIIRPPQLTGEYQEPQQTTKKEYCIGQEDEASSGSVHRYVIGKIVSDILHSNEMLPKVTFNCHPSTRSENLKLGELKNDGPDAILKPEQHQRVRKRNNIVIIAGLVALLLYIFQSWI